MGDKHFATGFASTRGLMSRMWDVLVTEFRLPGAGDTTERMVSMSLLADSVDDQPVK